MKWFLMLLATSLTATEKLDRTYLPPSGAKFSGGNAGDILTPRETPDLTQIGPTPINSIATSLKELDSNRQPSAKQLPVTTTSYAFSQTTTFPSIKSFEANPVPSNLIPSFPTQNVEQLSNLDNIQNLPYHSQNQGLGAFGSNVQSGLLDQNIIGPQYEIPILFQQPISSLGFINSPDDQRVNEHSNQYSGVGIKSSGPAIPIIESVAQVEGLKQYPNERNGLKQQEPSIIATQSNIMAKDQHNENKSQGMSAENVLHNPDSSISIDTTQPFFIQDYQDQGSTNLGSTMQVQPFHEIQSIHYPESISDIKVNQPRLENNGVSSTSSSLPSSVRPSRPQAESDRTAVILKYDNTRTPNGYSYSFETSNGIRADENGIVEDGIKAQGSYSYIGDDGKVYSVFYTADENGFQPRGDHLPTPPPIPEAIKKVIEESARDEAAGITDDGSYDENKYGYKEHYSLGNQYHNHRNEIEHKNIQVISGINDDGKTEFESSKLGNTRVPSKNYSSRKGSGQRGDEDNSALKISNLHFSERDKNESITSGFRDKSFLVHIPDVDTHISPISEEFNGQLDKVDFKHVHPITISRVTDIMQTKMIYPDFKINSAEEIIGKSNNKNGFESVPDNGIGKNGQENAGKASASLNNNSFEISKRRQNDEQEPDRNNNYIIGKGPQVDHILGHGNVQEIGKQTYISPVIDNNQDSNYQQPTNENIIPQVMHNGYFYDSPHRQFDISEVPTRFKDDKLLSMTRLNQLSNTPRPFLTPEVHNQPLTSKPQSNRLPTTPEPFMTSRVPIIRDESYNDDEDYTIDRNIEDEDTNTTAQPDAKLNGYARYPLQPSQTVMSRHPQSTLSKPSKYDRNEIPSKNIKFLPSQESVSVLPINNVREPEMYQSARSDNNLQKETLSKVVEPSYGIRIPPESKISRITTEQTDTRYEQKFKTNLPSGSPNSYQILRTSTEYQNQPDMSQYTVRPKIPERLDFETTPRYYEDTIKEDNFVTPKSHSASAKPGTFHFSEPKIVTSEITSKSPYSYGLTSSSYATTTEPSTLSNYVFPGSLEPQVSQNLSPGYQYRSPEQIFSISTSPSIIGKVPSVIISSTQPSLLSEAYPVVQQSLVFPLVPDAFNQNPIENELQKPIISDFRSSFSIVGQDTTQNTETQYPDEENLKRQEETSDKSSSSDLSDRGGHMIPTYDIEESLKYPKYNKGEDFSGPKQPQRYDAQSGYHYR